MTNTIAELNEKYPGLRPSIARLIVGIVAALEVIPQDNEVELHRALDSVAVGARMDNKSPDYWRKRTMQLFGNRVYELTSGLIGDAALPDWIGEATIILDTAVRESADIDANPATQQTLV
jgi:hypothetical protein